jgi:hypothetical protein
MMTAPLTGQKGHEVLRSTPNSGQRGQMGQSDPKKEQQTATDATTKIAHQMCSIARRMASREALRAFEIERNYGLGGARTHNQRLKRAILSTREMLVFSHLRFAYILLLRLLLSTIRFHFKNTWNTSCGTATDILTRSL